LAAEGGGFRQRQGATGAADAVARQFAGAVAAEIQPIVAGRAAQQASAGKHEIPQRPN